MIIAGLTGGIATGKSTVSGILKKRGAKIIDADVIARQVVMKGLPAYNEIVNHFGRRVIGVDGEIDRKYLGDIIFNDSLEKRRLNRIVHPHVFSRTEDEILKLKKAFPEAVVILDVPLLLEVGMDEYVSEIIVVYCPEHVQLNRLIKRDSLSGGDAMARIRSQMPIEEKRKLATIVIDNSGSLEDTEKRTLAVYADLKSRS